VILGIPGLTGSDQNLLFGAWDIYVDTNGDIYVSDYNNNRIQKVAQ